MAPVRPSSGAYKVSAFHQPVTPMGRILRRFPVSKIAPPCYMLPAWQWTRAAHASDDTATDTHVPTR